MQPDRSMGQCSLCRLHCSLPWKPTLVCMLQAVFLLIGKTSALTMNIAGVIKDWMLIFFSFYLFHAPVTALNLTGYAFCCSGAQLCSIHELDMHSNVQVRRLYWKVAVRQALIGAACIDRGGRVQLPEASDDPREGGCKQQQGARTSAVWIAGRRACRDTRCHWRIAASAPAGPGRLRSSLAFVVRSITCSCNLQSECCQARDFRKASCIMVS